MQLDTQSVTPPTDDLLTAAELTALAALGWRIVSQWRDPDGIAYAVGRCEYEWERRIAGGWRLMLRRGKHDSANT